jgi:hypothetical protein
MRETIREILTMVGAPPAPTGLSATDGDGQVALTWNALGTRPVAFWNTRRPTEGRTRSSFVMPTNPAGGRIFFDLDHPWRPWKFDFYRIAFCRAIRQTE